MAYSYEISVGPFYATISRQSVEQIVSGICGAGILFVIQQIFTQMFTKNPSTISEIDKCKLLLNNPTDTVEMFDAFNDQSKKLFIDAPSHTKESLKSQGYTDAESLALSVHDTAKSMLKLSSLTQNFYGCHQNLAMCETQRNDAWKNITALDNRAEKHHEEAMTCEKKADQAKEDLAEVRSQGQRDLSACQNTCIKEKADLQGNHEKEKSALKDTCSKEKEHLKDTCSEEKDNLQADHKREVGKLNNALLEYEKNVIKINTEDALLKLNLSTCQDNNYNLLNKGFWKRFFCLFVD